MTVPHQPAETRPAEDPSIDVGDLAENLHSRLFGILAALRKRDLQPIGGHVLTPAQRSLLYALRDGVRIPVTELAAHEGLSQKSFAGHIRALAELGLVQRIRDLSDRRRMWVQITAEGMRSQRAVAQTSLASTELTADEVAALKAAVVLLENLAQQALTEPGQS